MFWIGPKQGYALTGPFFGAYYNRCNQNFSYYQCFYEAQA
jgi:hypothetical protein